MLLVLFDDLIKKQNKQGTFSSYPNQQRQNEPSTFFSFFVNYLFLPQKQRLWDQKGWSIMSSSGHQLDEC